MRRRDFKRENWWRKGDSSVLAEELIQNADDADATKIVFIHDERSPALYVYNNASFTEEDWEGIQLAGRSFKRNDPDKVGRFGIGFNSVYHITVFLSHIDVNGKVNPRMMVKSSSHQHAALESRNESETSTRFKLITQHSDDPKETKWLLTTCKMKKGGAGNLNLLAEKLSFSPQVDLAFPCGEKRDCGEGRLSCFLPLPNNESNKTGLPVYVNACFGLTDNRRQIKWQESDQKHDEHAVWNELLLKEVLPQTYLNLIKDAIELAQTLVLPVSCVYDLWPDITQVKHKDRWHAVALDVLQHVFRENMAVLSLAKDGRKFVPPSEALLPCNGPTSSDVLAALERTLVSCGENLVTLPQNISRAIAEAHPRPDTLKHVTPPFVRHVLRRMDMHTLSKGDKLHLLEYVLSDGKYKELEGLQLLPLSDGSFRAFTSRKVDTALIDSSTFPR
ncbi:unnamed protein product [Tetraodon nigroviridis]|uniref:(spotted green pufferfish) hypothetical protein n=1 Tax=Tetraodon nigroviridis TaxID=99883 RepID=Q4RQQ5_TETNG|nr:unnamed protein product [Tetraodon nigroviridis]